MDYPKEHSSDCLSDDSENLSLSLWKSRRSVGESSEFEESLFNTRTDLKNNENIQKLTINKLHYDSIGLVGREREIATLKACLDRLVSEQYTRKELVFLNGYSGVGKSTLANTLVESTDRMTSAICGRGKFDLKNRDEPYGGIAAAFGEIFRTIATRQGSDEEKAEDSAKDIGHTISSELGSEVELLVKLIPELEQILPTTRRPSTNGENAGFNTQAEQERWKYAFRVLTRVLNSYISPVVLILDDLQWADVSSLCVVDYLISDTQNTNDLIIVGCLRSNEVDDTHILSKLITELESKKEKSLFNITDIEVGSFGVDEVNKVVTAMLAVDDEERTLGLAEICYRRTLGNPHFLIEFITMLEEEDLIHFNLGLLNWVWDEKRIDNETMSTANVVNLLQARMRKLPEQAQLLLEYAACLGSSFRLPTLELVWKNHGMRISESPGDKNIVGMLSTLEEGNFIESCGVGVYRWVHDKVQEAALSLDNAADATFQFEIGSVLYHSLDPEELDESLFEVVNLINKGNVKRRPEFAELNMHAAEKAKKLSAFNSAATYVSTGINFLPRDKWTQYHDLTLHLYTLGAELELALGRAETMEAYSSEVLSRSDCSALDKISLYETKANKLSSLDLKYEETIDFCLKVLKELDLKLMLHSALQPIQAISSLLRTVRMAKKTAEQVYEDLKPMNDPKQDAVMALLARLINASFLCNNEFVLIMASTKMVRLTLQYGVNAHSGFGFSTLGLLTLAVLGDLETGLFFAEMALLMQKKVSVKYTAVITHFVAFDFVFPWKLPLLFCSSPFLDAYKSGMRAGNTEYALWCLASHQVLIPFVTGKPLGVLLKQCQNCVSQMEEFNQQEQVLLMRLYLQMLLNLTGKSKERTRLQGEAFNLVEFENATPLNDATIKMLQTALFIFFGDFESAANLALQCRDNYEKIAPAHFLGMTETFHRGVALYAMARHTRKREYIKAAKLVKKTITKWTESGNPNVRYFHSFLNAEQAAVDKDYKKAGTFYQEAIVAAARTGYLHHAALCNERYADFLRKELGDEDEASYRMEEAIRFYGDWGAEAKVEMLMDPLK